MIQKNILCIGAGYVGVPSMAMIAYKCPDCRVTVADIDHSRINAWDSSVLPIYEPGLNEIIQKTRNINLFFSTDIEKGIKTNDIIFVCVNTPTKNYGVGAGEATDLQFLETDGIPLYLRVADLVANKWNTNGQCGLVVGATFPNELAAVRQAVGDTVPLLVPGIGAQGGDIAATCAAGCNAQGTGMMINSSRAILYAQGTGHWTQAAAAVARQTRDDINAHR